MTTCARCGHDLGIGRYCLNCGHPVGEPVPEGEQVLAVRPDEALPDQAPGLPIWMPWAVGVVLLLVLLVVLVSCLGGE